MAREAAPLLDKREVEYLGIEARSILNRCSSPRMPFTWTINPYRGCEFGCRYCYARYTHEFMGLNRWEDFEEKIYVKRDAARTLVRELSPDRLAGQSIALGTATDPYQPAERRYRVTRSLLAVMAAARDLRLSITTKSDLVVRDIDLLRRISERSGLQVNLTVTTLDRRLARVLEFRAPTPELRLKALRTLRQAGIVAGVNIAPVLPDITDGRANLEAVIAAAKDHGATHVYANVLFLKPSAQQAFFPFLERHFPHLARRYAARFARSAFLDRAYKERTFRLVADLKRKHGFANGPEFEMPAALHETEAEQLSLLQIESPAPSLPCVGTPPSTSCVGEASIMRYSAHDKSHRPARSGGCQ
jgi:DNA repair photolyase